MIEAWQFSLSGNSGTRSEKNHCFVERKSGRIRPREVLGNHRQQTQQSGLELGLRISHRRARANDLDC